MQKRNEQNNRPSSGNGKTTSRPGYRNHKACRLPVQAVKSSNSISPIFAIGQSASNGFGTRFEIRSKNRATSGVSTSSNVIDRFGLKPISLSAAGKNTYAR